MTDPRQTAQDLRAAAQAVTDYGHTRYEYVDPKGHVCAAGAVGVATGFYIRNFNPTDMVYDYAVPGPITISAPPAITLRYTNALEALAPLLPTSCDGSCITHDPNYCSHAPDEPCTMPDHYHAGLADEHREMDRVFHYNDFICEGGEELALLLTQAAEKIEADLP